VASKLIGAEQRRPGRPRSEKSRQAILRAAAELLHERGLSEISMDEVAARAGASKATIYRWWPSKELLAVDAVLAEWGEAVTVPPDTGSLRGDLEALIRPWVRLLRKRPFGRVIAAVVAEAQSDPQFAKVYRAHFVEPRRRDGRVPFERAIARGDIPPDTDIEVALDLLYGPIYHRLLHGHAPLTERFALAVVDAVATVVRVPAG
jgi:AcrR family transcriptional regulator